MTVDAIAGGQPQVAVHVDAKAVAKKIFFASFVNSGQVCMAIKRIYAHESVYEDLCAALVEEARKAKVGNGLDPATELGPVDFSAIARAVGARGARVDRDDAFEPALRAALAADRPTVIQLALDRRWVSVDRQTD